MRKKNRDLKQTKIEIIPMIDTMFFLLVFFILSSVGAIKLQGININLPAPSNTPTTPQKQTEKPLDLTIAIQADNTVYVNKSRLGPNESVQSYLEREVRKQKGWDIKQVNSDNDDSNDVNVVISAHANAKYDVMVRCIDQARDAGIFKFALVPVDLPETPPATGG
jgi:biopolymer transport protein ExbD